jgi:dTDP-4-amino-4,6-dideoxygalactose transaminase
MTEQRSLNGARLSGGLAEVPGIRTPHVPPDRTHVYCFFPVMVEPEQMGLDRFPTDLVRATLKAALRAEGVPIDEWQPGPIPSQTLFQERRGYGRGCPWTCGHVSRDVRYDPADYPVAVDICQRRLVLGASFSPLGPPNDVQVMDRIAAVFHKVLVEHRAEFADLLANAGDHGVPNVAMPQCVKMTCSGGCQCGSASQASLWR